MEMTIKDWAGIVFGLGALVISAASLLFTIRRDRTQVVKDTNVDQKDARSRLHDAYSIIDKAEISLLKSYEIIKQIHTEAIIRPDKSHLEDINEELVSCGGIIAQCKTAREEIKERIYSRKQDGGSMYLDKALYFTMDHFRGYSSGVEELRASRFANKIRLQWSRIDHPDMSRADADKGVKS